MTNQLSSIRATALYVGALLGPGLLLLPGLAARLAGPASLLAWAGMLVLSGLFASVFVAFGKRVRSNGGVAAYAALGLGERPGRAVAWCFLAGVVAGAPIVCLIGAAYVGVLAGVGHLGTIAIAAALLGLVLVVTSAGARAGASVQLALVAVLVVLIAVAAAGSTPHLRAANWTPFAPHGWSAVGSASAVLALSFIGWEAIAPMTSRLRDPRRQLPRVIGAAFVITAVIYLALAASTIGVLGMHAGSSVPLAELLRVAIGPTGRVVAAVLAVALTLAAVNAYVSGAGELAAQLRRTGRRSDNRSLQLAIAVVGALALTGAAAGFVDTAQLVAVPTALFLTVYLGCMVSAARVLRGPARACALLATPAVVAVLAFTGRGLAVAALVVGAAYFARAHEIRRSRSKTVRNPLLMPGGGLGSVTATATSAECGATS